MKAIKMQTLEKHLKMPELHTWWGISHTCRLFFALALGDPDQLPQVDGFIIRLLFTIQLLHLRKPEALRMTEQPFPSTEKHLCGTSGVVLNGGDNYLIQAVATGQVNKQQPGSY